MMIKLAELATVTCLSVILGLSGAAAQENSTAEFQTDQNRTLIYYGDLNNLSVFKFEGDSGTMYFDVFSTDIVLTGEGAPDAFIAGPINGFWYDPEGEYVQCPPRNDPHGTPHTSWGQAQMTFRGDHGFMLVGMTMTLDLGACMGPMDNTITGSLVKINP